MFGFGKQRVFEKMGDLYQKSQIAMYSFLKSKRYKVKGSMLEGEDRALMAAAVTNFMLGREAVQMHLDKFDIEEIESIGQQLIEENQNLKELVVQSMRVYLVLYHEGLMDIPIEMGIIEEYGHEFPDSPSPGSYESLLNRLDDWMPPPTST